MSRGGSGEDSGGRAAGWTAMVIGLRSVHLPVLLAVLFTAGTIAQEAPPAESPSPAAPTTSEPAAQQEPLDLGVVEEVEVGLRRREIDAIYRERFADLDELSLLRPVQGAEPVPIYSVVRFAARDRHAPGHGPDDVRHPGRRRVRG